VQHDVGASMSATPTLADPRGAGSLELIGVSWEILPHGTGQADAGDVKSHLLRLDLDVPPPGFVAWGSCMGTWNDGRYRRPGTGSGG